METKKEIRKKVLALRDALTPCERLRSQVLLTERILGHQWYYRASEVLLFASYGSEIDTSALIEDALHCGKKVFLPKITGDQMVFYRILPGEKLEAGYRGIPEPAGTADREQFFFTPQKEETALMLMPGVAFDVYRNRIGYGKGFYDRYLADKERLHTIAIGFDCQMVPVIESDKTDIRPMQVICL